jgi:hypothetical protein
MTAKDNVDISRVYSKYLIGIMHRASEVAATPFNKQEVCLLILLTQNLHCTYESLNRLHAQQCCRRSCRDITANVL